MSTDLTTPPPARATGATADAAVGRVYGIYDRDDGALRYVGQTRGTLEDRLGHHWRKARRGATGPLHDWLRTLAESPVIVALETVPLGELTAAERRWIESLRGRADVHLLNRRHYSADGWPPLSPEHRAKIGEANRGRRHTAEAMERMSAGRRGKSLSAEHRAALSQSRRGRPHSPEHNAALSAAAARTWERRRAREAQRAARSAAAKASWQDPDVRERRRQGVVAWWARRRAATAGVAADE